MQPSRMQRDDDLPRQGSTARMGQALLLTVVMLFGRPTNSLVGNVTPLEITSNRRNQTEIEGLARSEPEDGPQRTSNRKPRSTKPELRADPEQTSFRRSVSQIRLEWFG